MWKSTVAKGGGNKKRFQYCTDPSGAILYLRALHGHSGRNPIDPSLQEKVLIPNNFFEYIYHIGCAINLHSITNSGLIPGGQNLSKGKQTVFFAAVDPLNKEHRDPDVIDLTEPRLAWYKQKNGEDIKTRCTGSILNLLNRKDLGSIKRDRTQSSFTTHSQLIVSRKLLWWNLEKIIHEKENASPRLHPKISFKDNWVKELGSEDAAGGEDSQQTQPRSKKQLPSTGRPVSEQPSGSLTQEIGKDVLFGCGITNPRTGRPVNASSFSQSCVPVSVERVDQDKDANENEDADQTRTVRLVSEQPTGLFTQLEEIDTDFRVSGLPHAVVKQAENFRVRELVKKIESHPHREALHSSRLAAKWRLQPI